MMIRKKMLSLALLSSLAVGGATVVAPLPADARVNVSINLGDPNYSWYRTGLTSYFRVPEQDLHLLSQRGLTANELPVALMLANRTGISVQRILDLRTSGYGWHQIVSSLGASPEIFYTQSDYYGGPYERIYRYPASEWDSLTLSDDDYVNLANLKFYSDHYGYEPRRIVELRSRGNDFLSIAGLIGNIAAGAAYDGDVDTGDVLGGFLMTAANFFGTQDQDVYMLRQRGLYEDEIPVALYLASRSGISALTLAEMRLGGLSWMDVTRRYNLGSDIFYYPVDDRSIYSYDQYGRVYRLFESRPRSQWGSLSLADSDIVNLVNLRMMSEVYDMPPRRVVELRQRGSNFSQIHNTIQQQTGVNVRPQQRANQQQRQQQRVEARQGQRQQGNDARQDRIEARQQQQRVEARQERVEAQQRQERVETRQEQRQQQQRVEARQQRLEAEQRQQQRQERVEQRQEQQRVEVRERRENIEQRQERVEQRQERVEQRQEQQQQTQVQPRQEAQQDRREARQERKQQREEQKQQREEQKQQRRGDDVQ